MNPILPEFYKGKRVMLTGHTGFKGSWLTLWLTHLGAEVIGYALNPPTIPSLFAECKIEDRILSIKGDVRDYPHLHSIISQYQPEIVFHLAAQALVRRSYQDPLETYSTNVMGTVHLLEAVRETPGVKAAVIVTSDKCYENREWVWGYRENDAIGGSDPYSSSKGCAELAAAAYSKSFFLTSKYGEDRIAIATARAGNVIGGGDWAEDRIVPDCIRAIRSGKPVVVRSPHAVRPWQHVLEPLSGYLLLAEKLYQEAPEFGGAWNFGPSEKNAQTVGWLVQHINALWGGGYNNWRLDEKPGLREADYLRLDSSKARQLLGWRSGWDTELALKKTVEWYQAYYRQADMLATSMEQIAGYEQALELQKEG